MENQTEFVDSIPKKMRVLSDITLASEEKRNKGKRNPSNITEDDWKYVKTPKVEKSETYKQLSVHGNFNDIENVTVKEENFDLETETDSTKQWCHVCNLNFENLDFHFLISHKNEHNDKDMIQNEVPIKKEIENYKSVLPETEDQMKTGIGNTNYNITQPQVASEEQTDFEAIDIKEEIIEDAFEVNSHIENNFAQVDIFHDDIKVETSEQNLIDPLNIKEELFDFEANQKSKKIDNETSEIEEIFDCDRCDQVLCNRQGLDFHKNTKGYLGKQLHYCDEENCEFKSCTLAGIKVHESKIHPIDKNKTYKCDKCDFETNGPKAKKFIKRHKLCDEYQNSSKSPCIYCELSFCSIKSLTGHIKKVHGNKVDCKKCGTVYICSHMYGNTNEIFNCDRCDQVLSSHQSLESHKNTKGYIMKELHYCDEEYCEFKSCNVEGVRAHKGRIHPMHKNKTFKCDKCDYEVKGTEKIKTIEIHKLSHGYVNSSKSPCPSCELSFCTVSNLTGHISKVHGNKIECNKCGVVLRSLGELKHHKNSFSFCNPFIMKRSKME